MSQHNVQSIAVMLSAVVLTNVAAAADCNYSTLESNYPRDAPAGFREAMKRDFGEDHPNSCAIRLAFALEAVNGAFFADFRSLAVYKRKPIRAKELADYIASRIPGGVSIAAGATGRKAVRGQKGIIYFANIRPRPRQLGVSWHISLWNGKTVVDEGDYFDRATSVRFWPLN